MDTTSLLGATIGALGLAAFAFVAGAGFHHTIAVLALGAATATWLVSSCLLYLVVEMLLRGRAAVDSVSGQRE